MKGPFTSLGPDWADSGGPNPGFDAAQRVRRLGRWSEAALGRLVAGRLVAGWLVTGWVVLAALFG
jgi:hypothetical protein